MKFDSVVFGNGFVRLCFTAMVDKSYTVQYKPSLSGALWEKLTNVCPGPTRAVEVPDSSPAQFHTRLYRLVTPALP